MRNRNLYIILLFVGVLFVVVGFNFMFYPYKKLKEVVVYNNLIKSKMATEELKDIYIESEKRDLKTTFYNNFYDAVKNAKYGPTSFVGKLTHYGPDCKGCGGTTACKGINVRNGNIYYNDKEYGKVRIVAADRKLPCGSIIKINVDKYDKNGMYAIVLDRGGIIKGAKIDLLKTSERAKSPVRTINKASFDIIRLGYKKK